MCYCSTRKQLTFPVDTIGFPVKRRLKKESRNSILMTRHYPDVGGAYDWSGREGNLLQSIRCTTQIWVVTNNQYGISVLISQTSFRGETNGSVVKCRLFSEANVTVVTHDLVDRLPYPPEPTTNITLLGNSARPCTLITSGVGDQLTINNADTSWSSFSYA